MARPLRIEFPGALYHVTSRGNARQNIFKDDLDRRQFLKIYARNYSRLGWRCYAYCLMSNHYHFVIETPLPNLSAGMRDLNGNYTRFFNTRHERVGHLFQGRYKAFLVDRDEYLLEAVRYVELNPVRAEIVASPEKWNWSSYRSTVGIANSPVWLHSQEVLQHFNGSASQAKMEYSSFISEGIPHCDSIYDLVKKNLYLGNDSFVGNIEKAIRDQKTLSSEIPREQHPESKPHKSLSYYEKAYTDQREGMARAYESGDFTISEIARFYQVHYSTVSRVVKKFRKE
ncbi:MULTISPECIES: transposase [Aminobacterium]|jgi:putative transposase|uniref:Transposase IS200-like domain-containing protein n=1 Tax=Aminobacterium colombiense (strain DSM 12261 / ALA-1) TaxID=572547 RepID=D5EH56_AMICL|nr:MULTISPECIES: transposase [Aminobacterium]ADE57888.1 protein of unknown function DUF1568 [Aminobacterium colombiense DSM 12261]MDD2379857.1 transposase [Aminobacterium colombiense]NLK30396.1 addiction module toxin RelE [Aminobacterium colombiense]